MQRIGLILLLTAITCNAGANFCIKGGMGDKAALVDEGLLSTFLTVFGDPVVLVGFLFFGGAFVVYSAVLSTVDLSLAYPIMTGGTFLLVLLGSMLLFDEAVTLTRAAGMLSIATGISVATAKG
ncbi:MAG: hypothetical protein K9L28_03150 [Synergistales bacterium]|nr:hypothetical protein [Synergistales bacterium]